jgi:4-hydroxybenzoate polyprenyltransferase
LKLFKFDWYKIFQALSLDVVVGVVIFSLAVGSYYNVQIPFSVLLCLSIATWIIYTFDHLLDAKKISGKASTYRHQFHQRYEQPLFFSAVGLMIVGSITMLYLPRVILIIGLIGVVFSLLYFLLAHKISFWAKECYIAMVYTFAIFISPVCLLHPYISIVQWLLIPQVYLLVFSNLLIFSWFDFLNDKQDGHLSSIIHWGIKRAEKIITFILASGIVLNVTIIFLKIDHATFVMQLLLLFMYGFLILLFKKNQLFRKNDVYRIIGDGIFFIPLFFLIYAKFR